MTLQRIALWTSLTTAIVFVAAASAQAPKKLSDTEFRTLAWAAKTTTDHSTLPAHDKAHADGHEADATRHEALANQYQQAAPSLAGESRRHAAHSREAAEAMQTAEAGSHLRDPRRHVSAAAQER